MSYRILIAIAFACGLTAQTPLHADLERQLWTSIKRALIGPEGDDYFQSSMKDAMLPRLKGTLISVIANDSGNALVLVFRVAIRRHQERQVSEQPHQS